MTCSLGGFREERAGLEKLRGWFELRSKPVVAARTSTSQLCRQSGAARGNRTAPRTPMVEAGGYQGVGLFWLHWAGWRGSKYP